MGPLGWRWRGCGILVMIPPLLRAREMHDRLTPSVPPASRLRRQRSRSPADPTMLHLPQRPSQPTVSPTTTSASDGPACAPSRGRRSDVSDCAYTSTVPMPDHPPRLIASGHHATTPPHPTITSRPSVRQPCNRAPPKLKLNPDSPQCPKKHSAEDIRRRPLRPESKPESCMHACVRAW